jgi:predicted PurR-regulated permease PerM
VAFGFLFATGALLAYFLGGLLLDVGNVLVLVVVSFFLAVGLNPAVAALRDRGLPRAWGVVVVTALVLVALALFFFALVPVISEQVAKIGGNVPGWLDALQSNQRVQRVEQEFQVIEKAKTYISDGEWASGLFGGVLGVGLAVLGFFANAFIVIVLTLYFLASMERTKHAIYTLLPASRRERVAHLSERILDSVGGYVAGAFVVATCAGVSSLVFLLVVGLGEYAVALAAVVALLDVIPMIGATIGAVVVTSIGFATDPRIGLACLIFYIVYQQFENYVIYPRVMQRSVNVPGSITVIAALVGAGLLGVVGALLAIPTAAAILLLVREVWVPRQEAH